MSPIRMLLLSLFRQYPKIETPVSYNVGYVYITRREDKYRNFFGIYIDELELLSESWHIK